MCCKQVSANGNCLDAPLNSQNLHNKNVWKLQVEETAFINPTQISLWHDIQVKNNLKTINLRGLWVSEMCDNFL